MIGLSTVNIVNFNGPFNKKNFKFMISINIIKYKSNYFSRKISMKYESKTFFIIKLIQN